MNQTIIFANGDLSSEHISIQPSQTVIAADGGARHCLNLGITPQIVIGDFDSLSDEEISILVTEGVELIRYSTNKNETDLELAINYAANQGGTDISLYGLFGGRWDMTFANVLLLASPSYTGINFRIIDGSTTAYILRAGETLQFQSQPGTTVSILPLQSARGISYQGLEWLLDNASLPFGTPRGVSNVIIETNAQITLEEGIILVFVINSNEI